MPPDQNRNRPGIEIRIRDGRLTVRGDCDLSNAPQIEACLASFGGTALQVDLSGVTFFDSAALLVFLRAVRRNSHLRVVEPSASVQRILELTDTVDYLVNGRDIFD